MNTTARNLIAMVGLTTSLAIPAIATAQSRTTTPPTTISQRHAGNPERAAAMAKIASELGVTTARLKAAFDSARPAGGRPTTPPTAAMRLAHDTLVANALGVPVSTLQALLQEYKPAKGGPGQGRHRGPLPAAIAAQLGLSTDAVKSALDSAKAEYKLTPGMRPTAAQRAEFQADVAKTLSISTASVTAAFDAVKAARDAARAAR